MVRVRKEKKREGRSSLRKVIGWVVFTLVVFQVVLTNSLVTGGREISRLVAERDRLRAEIASLENEIARASSLAAIQEGAARLEMKPGSIEFLPPPPLASASLP